MCMGFGSLRMSLLNSRRFAECQFYLRAILARGQDENDGQSFQNNSTRFTACRSPVCVEDTLYESKTSNDHCSILASGDALKIHIILISWM